MFGGYEKSVLHGCIRNSQGIISLDFPTFSISRYAQDQKPRGKVIDFRVEIEIERVHIRPGDIVYGDMDGVCIIPRQIEEDVIHHALEKAYGEKIVRRKAIENGMSAKEAYKEFSIL